MKVESIIKVEFVSGTSGWDLEKELNKKLDELFRGADYNKYLRKLHFYTSTSDIGYGSFVSHNCAIEYMEEEVTYDENEVPCENPSAIGDFYNRSDY